MTTSTHRRTGIIALILLTGLLAGIPAVRLIKFQAAYGQAEKVVEQLRDIHFSIADEVEKEGGSTRNLTQQDFLDVLSRPEYRELGLQDMYLDIPLRGDELIWFLVNDTYTVGLERDGRIRWMRDGMRSGE